MDPKDRGGFTPVLWAVGSVNERVIEFLVQKGANPNVRRQFDQKVPFQSTSNPRIQRLLMENGFDVN